MRAQPRPEGLVQRGETLGWQRQAGFATTPGRDPEPAKRRDQQESTGGKGGPDQARCQDFVKLRYLWCVSRAVSLRSRLETAAGLRAAQRAAQTGRRITARIVVKSDSQAAMRCPRSE